MTFDEALTAAVLGQRVRCRTMQPGCYVEHTFSRGFLRCWPVDRVEDEPNRTQCEFRATTIEMAEEWETIERPKVDKWGKPLAHYREEPQLGGGPSKAWATPIAVNKGRFSAFVDDLRRQSNLSNQMPPEVPKTDKWGRSLH